MRVLPKLEAKALLRAEVKRLPAELKGCLPCALARKVVAPELLVRENDVAICTLEKYAARMGHLVVVPKQHVEKMCDSPWSLYRDMQFLVWEAAVTLEKLFSPERVYTAQLGSPRPRSTAFSHVCVNVVPIYETDERSRASHVFSWTRSVSVYDPIEALSLAEKIRASWI